MGVVERVRTRTKLRAASAAEVVGATAATTLVVVVEDIVGDTAEARSKIRSAEWSWPSAP